MRLHLSTRPKSRPTLARARPFSSRSARPNSTAPRIDRNGRARRNHRRPRQTVGPSMAPTNIGVAQHHGISRSMIAAVDVHREHGRLGGFARAPRLHAFLFERAGENVSTINAGFAEIYASRSLQTGGEKPTVTCRLRNWWEGRETYAVQGALRQGAWRARDAFRGHAVRVSRPHQVAPLDPEIALRGFTDATDYRAPLMPHRLESGARDAKQMENWRSSPREKWSRTSGVSRKARNGRTGCARAPIARCVGAATEAH